MAVFLSLRHRSSGGGGMLLEAQLVSRVDCGA
jgi:hypothetical protein